MSQHAVKVWIRFQSSKTGKTDHPSLQNTKTVTIPKTKTSSHEFTVHSLLYAVQAQKHLLTGMQMFWKRTGLRGSAGTLRQVIFTNKSCTRQTTN